MESRFRGMLIDEKRHKWWIRPIRLRSGQALAADANKLKNEYPISNKEFPMMKVVASRQGIAD